MTIEVLLLHKISDYKSSSQTHQKNDNPIKDHTYIITADIISGSD